jgi:acetyl esterase
MAYSLTQVMAAILGIRRSIDLGAHLASRVIYALPVAHPGRYGVDVVCDVPYRDSANPAHTLDVYRPRIAGRPPAVLYVHGGAFSTLSKDTHRVMALNFAARGYVVFNINYRLGPTHPYPAPLEDAAAALSWVETNSARYGADPNRLVLAGESAGANLVTALATSAIEPRPEPFARTIYERNPPIRAVVAIYGLLDLHDMHRFTTHPRLMSWLKAIIIDAGTAYVGRPIRARAVNAPLASPLRILSAPPSDAARTPPPFFAAAGTADPLLDDSRRLQVALEGRGGLCQLEIFPGEIHGFNALVWRKAAQDKWRAVGEFLRHHVR